MTWSPTLDEKGALYLYSLAESIENYWPSHPPAPLGPFTYGPTRRTGERWAGTRNVNLRLSYQGQDYVVRRPKPDRPQIISRTSYPEEEILQWLHTSGVTPRLCHTGGSRGIIMEYLPGDRATFEGPAWTHWAVRAPIDIPRIVTAFAEVRQPVPDIGTPDDSQQYWDMQCYPRRGSWLMQFNQNPEFYAELGVDRGRIMRTAAWEPSALRPTYFMHGDLQVGNLLMTKNGIVALDLEMGHYGDPAANVGKALMAFPFDAVVADELVAGTEAAFRESPTLDSLAVDGLWTDSHRWAEFFAADQIMGTLAQRTGALGERPKDDAVVAARLSATAADIRTFIDRPMHFLGLPRPSVDQIAAALDHHWGRGLSGAAPLAMGPATRRPEPGAAADTLVFTTHTSMRHHSRPLYGNERTGTLHEDEALSLYVEAERIREIHGFAPDDPRIRGRVLSGSRNVNVVVNHRRYGACLVRMPRENRWSTITSPGLPETRTLEILKNSRHTANLLHKHWDGRRHIQSLLPGRVLGRSPAEWSMWTSVAVRHLPSVWADFAMAPIPEGISHPSTAQEFWDAEIAVRTAGWDRSITKREPLFASLGVSRDDFREDIETPLVGGSRPVVLCHRDPNIDNWLWTPEDLRIVDVEMAGPADITADIGKHLVESPYTKGLLGRMTHSLEELLPPENAVGLGPDNLRARRIYSWDYVIGTLTQRTEHLEDLKREETLDKRTMLAVVADIRRAANPALRNLGRTEWTTRQLMTNIGRHLSTIGPQHTSPDIRLLNMTRAAATGFTATPEPATSKTAALGVDAVDGEGGNGIREVQTSSRHAPIERGLDL